jgi:hypothetical protein
MLKIRNTNEFNGFHFGISVALLNKAWDQMPGIRDQEPYEVKDKKSLNPRNFGPSSPSKLGIISPLD